MGTDPRYSVQTVADVCGIKRATLHAWLARGHVVVPSRGERFARELTFGQVLLICALAELERQGVRIDRSAPLLQPIEDELFRKAVLFERKELGLLTIIDGVAAFKTRKVVTQMFSKPKGGPSRSYFMLDLDLLAEDLLKKLDRDRAVA
jgi:MerR HTH family regulatory protein